MSWWKKVIKIAINPIGAANEAVAKEIAKAVGADKNAQELVGNVVNPVPVVAVNAANAAANAAEAGVDLVENQVRAFKAQIDLVRAIMRGDIDGLKHAAADWISAQAGTAGSSVAMIGALMPRLTALVPQLRGLYMDDPAIEVMNDEGFVGDTIYYVNGINTNHKPAMATARLLSTHLKRPIGLLHNDTAGMPADIAESCYDRAWPNLNLGELVPQVNAATRRLTSLLYNATAKISVVTHSQGCLIMRNALLMADSFSSGSTAPMVAWVGAGMPLRDEEVIPKPAKYTPIIHPNDPAATYVGLRIDPEFFEQSASKHSIDEVYLPMISSDRFW